MRVLPTHASQQISTIRAVEHVQMAVLALCVRMLLVLDKFWPTDELEVVVVVIVDLLLVVIQILVLRQLLWLANLLIAGCSSVEPGS